MVKSKDLLFKNDGPMDIQPYHPSLLGSPKFLALAERLREELFDPKWDCGYPDCWICQSEIDRIWAW